MIVQTRVFSRTIDPRLLQATEADLQVEANAFLATLPFADVGEIRRGVQPVNKYGTQVHVWVEVIYLQE